MSRIWKYSTWLPLVAMMVIGCATEASNLGPVHRDNRAAPLHTNRASEPAPQGNYDYQHTVKKSDIPESPIAQGNRTVRRRIAVARFGDLMQPWGSPFDGVAAEATAETSLTIDADKGHVSLDERAHAGVGGDVQPCPAFSALLVDKLIDSNKFIVVEREDINKILLEQDFSRGPRVLPEQASKLRQIRGVELIITGSVAQVKPRIEEDQEKTIVFLRIIDVDTAEVVASSRVEGESVYQAVDQAAERIAGAVADVQWEAKVARFEVPDKLFLNVGSDDGVEEGDRFEIYSLGQEIRDFDEGTVLGQEKSLIGIVEVVSVEPRFCRALTKAQDKRSRYKGGDLAVYIPGPYSDDFDYYRSLFDGDTNDEGLLGKQRDGLEINRSQQASAVGPVHKDTRPGYQRVLGDKKPKDEGMTAPEKKPEPKSD